jgi:hypothetical protein
MTLNRWMPGLFERFLNSAACGLAVGGGKIRPDSAETAKTPPEGE